MTLFVIILIVAAVIWFMVFKTKKEKEVQSLSQKPAETSIMSTPIPQPAEPVQPAPAPAPIPTPAPTPEPPMPQPTFPSADNPQPPQGPTW